MRRDPPSRDRRRLVPAAPCSLASPRCALCAQPQTGSVAGSNSSKAGRSIAAPQTSPTPPTHSIPSTKAQWAGGGGGGRRAGRWCCECPAGNAVQRSKPSPPPRNASWTLRAQSGPSTPCERTLWFASAADSLPGRPSGFSQLASRDFRQRFSGDRLAMHKACRMQTRPAASMHVPSLALDHCSGNRRQRFGRSGLSSPTRYSNRVSQRREAAYRCQVHPRSGHSAMLRCRTLNTLRRLRELAPQPRRQPRPGECSRRTIGL